MQPGPLPLADLQRWMMAAVVGRHQGALPYAADQMILPSATMSAAERLELYRRSYVIRLLECLRGMHPALCHLVGEELFDAFALDYLHAKPSRSYTLFDLDRGFAAHLSGTRPDGGTCVDREPWPELIIDVVRLERAFLDVYDGPGVEDHAVRTSGDVAALPAGAAVTIEPVPCARLFCSRYPVADYVLAVRGGERPSVPLPAPAWLVLVRRDYVVTVIPLEAGSYAALDALFRGADSAEAAQLAGVEHRSLRHWIDGWADQGLFAEVRPATALPGAPDAAVTTPEGITCS